MRIFIQLFSSDPKQLEFYVYAFPSGRGPQFHAAHQEKRNIFGGLVNELSIVKKRRSEYSRAII
jgi:hypothetical protein